MSRATPLLAPSNEELTLDEWLLKSRSSCLSPMVCAFVAAGMVGYAWPSMPVLMPAYLDRTILNETDWFVDAHVGVNAMSGTSTALFALWGPGTMLFTAISDRSGRRPIFFAMVFCTLALTALSALAPSFGVYAAARALSGASIGAGGAIGYVLVAEWSTPADISFLTTMLNVLYALAATVMVCVIGEEHERQLSWRVQVLSLVGIIAAYACVTLPMVLESPRYLLASGQRERAESALRWLARAGGRLARRPPVVLARRRRRRRRRRAAAAAAAAAAAGRAVAIGGCAQPRE